MSGWIVSGLLYALGCVMAYVAIRSVDDEDHWCALLWPILVAANIAIGLYERFRDYRDERAARRASPPETPPMDQRGQV